MNPRTTAHLRAVPNSSRVYLAKTKEERRSQHWTPHPYVKRHLPQCCCADCVLWSDVRINNGGSLSLRLFWWLGDGSLCGRLNRSWCWLKILRMLVSTVSGSTYTAGAWPWRLEEGLPWKHNNVWNFRYVVQKICATCDIKLSSTRRCRLFAQTFWAFKNTFIHYLQCISCFLWGLKKGS